MTPQELVTLIHDAVTEALDERAVAELLPEEVAFVRALIRSQKRRADIVDNVLKQVVGWSLVAALAWVGFAVYETAKAAIFR